MTVFSLIMKLDAFVAPKSEVTQEEPEKEQGGIDFRGWYVMRPVLKQTKI